MAETGASKIILPTLDGVFVELPYETLEKYRLSAKSDLVIQTAEGVIHVIPRPELEKLKMSDDAIEQFLRQIQVQTLGFGQLYSWQNEGGALDFKVWIGMLHLARLFLMGCLIRVLTWPTQPTPSRSGARMKTALYIAVTVQP